MEDNKGKEFFYAMSDAQEYDSTIRLTVPYYDLIHKTLLDVFYYHFGVNRNNVKPNEIEGVILDIGAGTGTEAISLLKSFQNLNVIAIDIARPMEVAFRENYLKIIKDSSYRRYKYIVDDIFKLEFSSGENKLYPYQDKKRIAAISAYCIHHFTLEDKEEVYKKMFDFLDDGGLFVNIDLFNYKSNVISKYAHHFDIEYIKNEFDSPSHEYIESQNIPIELRQKLKEKWLNHMEHDNILNSVESQIDILKKVGFKDVECVFKYFQQGIIIATK